MIIPIGQSFLAQQAGPSRMGRAMSLISVLNTLAPILGPVIGGVILAELSWRWIFYVNVPIGLAAILLGARVLPDGGGGTTRKLDVVGLVLLSPGLTLLVYGLTRLGSGEAMPPDRIIVPALIGLAMIAAFVVRARTTAHPLLDLSLFRERQFALANVAGFFFSGGLFGVLFLFPLFYQVVRGENALDAGLLMAPQGLGMMIGMTISGRRIDRSQGVPITPIGCLLAIVGTVTYAFVGVHSSDVLLSISMMVRGCGLGLITIVYTTAAYRRIPRESISQGTTVLSITSRIGGTTFTALLAVVLQKRIVASDHSSPAAVLAGKVTASAAAEISRAFDQTFIVLASLVVLSTIPVLMLHTGLRRREAMIEPAHPRRLEGDRSSPGEFSRLGGAITTGADPSRGSDEADRGDLGYA
jgi:EmrB/QacA subfamily drug resistance transporter